MIEKIIESFRKFPERNAFYVRDRYYTYADVARITSDIKSALLPHIPELSPKYIAVIINEDIETYCSCITVLLCGCGYLPLNPMNPAERNLETMEQSDIRIILTSDPENENLLNPDGRYKFIHTRELESHPVDLTFPPSSDEDPAYVIFTSGSTGKPKGAPISRGNLNAFLDSVWHIGWDISEEDRFLQMSSMTFDMSILTFIIPLCIGACIYTVPETEIKYIYGYRLMEEHQITFVAIVPSTLSYLKPYFGEIDLPTIRYSLVCGEAFPVHLADQWQKCAPNSTIVNIYGPTEATVFTHSYHYRRPESDKAYNGIMALGDLVKNMEAVILDEIGKEVEPGEKGELCITGAQLTSGYLKNPDKNSESFFEWIHNGRLKRFYRTGDLVFLDKEGTYYYVGRKDYQVKIQGHRVELGEIEKHARECAGTEKAVAVAGKNEFGNYQIHLFMEKGRVTREEMIGFLKDRIPYYMVPSEVTILDSLPLNDNGKIDRKALKARIAD